MEEQETVRLDFVSKWRTFGASHLDSSSKVVESSELLRLRIVVYEFIEGREHSVVFQRRRLVSGGWAIAGAVFLKLAHNCRSRSIRSILFWRKLSFSNLLVGEAYGKCR